MPQKVAYLGPEGTYAEKAAFALAKLEKLNNPQFVPYIGLRSVIESVTNNECDSAVVPIENSVEGGVTASLDCLWNNPDLFIRRALVIPIQHCLVSKGSVKEISEVLSHPQALAQCNGWLQNNLPNALQLPTTSTAEAVRMVTGSNFRAAIAPRTSTRSTDLKELAFPINDIALNCTRFVWLEVKNQEQRGDISSVAFSLKANMPGALLKALKNIEEVGLNMSRIESRPSKRELGEYIFFIDLELTNKEEELVFRLLKELEPLCDHLVYFGSYPNNQMEID